MDFRPLRTDAAQIMARIEVWRQSTGGIIVPSGPAVTVGDLSEHASALETAGSDPASDRLLSAYIHRIKSGHELSAEEEAQQVLLLGGTHRDAAIQVLVLDQLGVVLDTARSYLMFEQPLFDLIQEGNVGLIKAIRQFSPAARERLRSVSLRGINREIGSFVVDNWSIASASATQEQRRLFVRTRGFRTGAGKMTAAQIRSAAKHLRVAKDVIERLEEVLGGGDVPFDAGAAGVRHHQIFDSPVAIRNDSILQIEEEQWLERMGVVTEQALDGLDDRAREIVRRRWLDKGRKARLRELAKEYHISGERIRQIQAQAFEVIKEAMESKVPAAEAVSLAEQE